MPFIRMELCSGLTIVNRISGPRFVRSPGCRNALAFDEDCEGVVVGEAAGPLGFGPADGVDLAEAVTVVTEEVDASADGWREVVL